MKQYVEPASPLGLELSKLPEDTAQELAQAFAWWDVRGWHLHFWKPNKLDRDGLRVVLVVQLVELLREAVEARNMYSDLADELRAEQDRRSVPPTTETS